jgi:aryl-alcohol dehydrogenase-like predicted oxidoreductase
LTLNPRWLPAQQDAVITRPIPSTGEQLPIIGCGSSGVNFGRLSSEGNVGALSEMFRAMFEAGGRVFDTSPSYGEGRVEPVAAQAIRELGLEKQIFCATKLDVARGGVANPAEARAQVEASFERFGKEPIDLIQVEGIAAMPTQLGILRSLKEEGRLRYIGATSTSGAQHEALEDHMRNEPLDFIGVDYSVDDRGAEDRVLRVAQDRGIAVIAYEPFGRRRLLRRAGGREVPAWAAEFGAHTWAQFFLKYVASHPAVTAITPSTSDAEHMLENMGAARARLPDDAERARMIELVDALPEA